MDSASTWPGRDASTARRALRLAAGAIFGAAVGAGTAGCAPSPEVIVRPDSAEAVRVRVEVVRTPETRAHGLMYRKELAPDAGMLFVFPKQAVQRFWMKNTYIPLDMIFIDDDKRVVGVVSHARPRSEAAVGVDGPSLYVLEVNAGFAERHGIRAGAAVEFSHVPEDAR